MTDHELLQKLFGSEALRPVLERLGRKLGRDPRAQGTITLRDASDATREATAALLGRPSPTRAKFRVRLADLEHVVQRSGAARNLADAVADVLGHPLSDPGTERRQRQQQWRELSAHIKGSIAISAKVRDWISQACHSGVLRRAAKDDLKRGEQLLQQLAACLTKLPLAEPQPLPVFADQVLGDPHALDADRPLSHLLVRAASILTGSPPGESAAHKRVVWAQVGIVLDELSSTVLVLNLRAIGTTPVDQMLRNHAELGLPCRITFRQLRLSMPTFDLHEQGMISVCENPSIIAAAADALGSRSGPLVCVEGQPSHAATRLLQQLAATSPRLRYHGDFDSAGVRIANQIITAYHAAPWRMAALDYLTAVGRARLRLKGEIPVTSWSPELQSAMQQNQKAVLEESVLPSLLDDLVSDSEIIRETK